MSADIVDLAYPAFMDNEVDSAAVILDIEPVADVESFAVNGQAFVAVRSGYHQRNELFGEVIRTVVI